MIAAPRRPGVRWGASRRREPESPPRAPPRRPRRFYGNAARALRPRPESAGARRPPPPRPGLPGRSRKPVRAAGPFSLLESRAYPTRGSCPSRPDWGQRRKKAHHPVTRRERRNQRPGVPSAYATVGLRTYAQFVCFSA
ncbi:putative uncharacterized protein ASB16-AS1 [Diceros bicornis minor]|uniref:putative uncharacterized protein ASB16-AS1 n=1 Tax=Diceros bicornis minor TaxID=77932 RepID=UPI0026F2A25C|nr:putative uncharacterized protein ASB16-AS1 [Diceros bicornis minor]